MKRAIVYLAEKGEAIRVYSDEPDTVKKKKPAAPAAPAKKAKIGKKAKAATATAQ